MITILELPLAELAGYGSVPISFQATARLRVEPLTPGSGDLAWCEEWITPFTKDYDAIPGTGPSAWSAQWNIANWGLLGAFEGQQRVGGAVLAWNTPGVDLLQGRADIAVLWDLRVHPDYRRQGVGAKLFAHAMVWAQERRCRHLVVETQDINVAACRFYERQGCYLGEVHPFAYQDFPDEVQLLWHKEL